MHRRSRLMDRSSWNSDWSILWSNLCRTQVFWLNEFLQKMDGGYWTHRCRSDGLWGIHNWSYKGDKISAKVWAIHIKRKIDGCGEGRSEKVYRSKNIAGKDLRVKSCGVATLGSLHPSSRILKPTYGKVIAQRELWNATLGIWDPASRNPPAKTLLRKGEGRRKIAGRQF